MAVFGAYRPLRAPRRRDHRKPTRCPPHEGSRRPGAPRTFLLGKVAKKGRDSPIRSPQGQVCVPRSKPVEMPDSASAHLPRVMQESVRQPRRILRRHTFSCHSSWSPSLRITEPQAWMSDLIFESSPRGRGGGHAPEHRSWPWSPASGCQTSGLGHEPHAKRVRRKRAVQALEPAAHTTGAARARVHMRTVTVTVTLRDAGSNPAPQRITSGCVER